MRLPKGVTPRGNKYRVSAGSGKTRVTATVDTVHDALDTRAVLTAELCIPRAHKTLQDAYQQTVQECWGQAKSGDELKRTALRVLEHFGPSFPLAQLTRTDVSAFEQQLRSIGNTNATINRKLAAISKMLHIAQEHGWIESLPIIKRQREGVGRTRYLDAQEEQAVLNLCNEWGKRDHAEMIQVLLDTGMRTGEVFNLEKRDINFHANLIHIFQNKTSHPRSLPMTTRVKDILFARTVTQMRPFPFDNPWLDYVWNRIRTVMGLQNDTQFVPYACRHTCATRLLQRGMTIPELQAWLGHKSIIMTMRYAHLSPTALLRGAQLLEQKEVPPNDTLNPSPDNPDDIAGGRLRV